MQQLNCQGHTRKTWCFLAVHYRVQKKKKLKKMATKGRNLSYPIHLLVWHNHHEELDQLLSKKQYDIEQLDPRGRTALHLAVTLGHLESTKVLLKHGADANKENRNNWTVLQEAVSSGDPDIVSIVLQHRDLTRYSRRTLGIPDLLQKLKEAPDFYVEMKWEFTSWVPLVSRMCPSDTYKVYKSGANVRIDTTLLGFDNMNWQRGSRSIVFKGNVNGNSAQVMEIDHDMCQVYTEVLHVVPDDMDAGVLQPSDDAVAARLTAPLNTTFIDVEKISFERNKSGIWGWRSDKTESINGHECKVFSASNVELVTKTRTEHLSEQDKARTKKTSRNPLESFLGVAEQEEKAQSAAPNGIHEIHHMNNNPCCITPEEYFDPDIDLDKRDIGRPIEQMTKVQKFKATLWLCENYPLALQEQVLPIIDLMATSNAHFQKLRDFITLQLPAGFPVKIEIPLFHVLNARITFGNIYASDESVQGVTCLNEGDRIYCAVDDDCFEPPSTYSRLGTGHHERIRDEDDELLQFAIQQSLLETGTENDEVTFWEALNKSRPSVDMQAEEERLLQRALAESMKPTSEQLSNQQLVNDADQPEFVNDSIINRTNTSVETYEQEQLRLALEMSQKQQREDEIRLRQEEEELERILKLSLTEK
ncbi:ankyrin repeat domain-containing protein 13D-like [Tubulanus polymorphus]|uniref:ankyrin repeat domain-containing protein 13D-like n=1 Tax=Tubulanus polymorphus TaxID=672921 RepID=UPI003DA34BC0